jgi:putative colanic acid biosynthesis acetyltransferase WcaF
VTQTDLSKSKTHWPVSVLVRRVIWTYGLEPLVRFWPKWFSPLRVWALRSMGARIGKSCLIMPGVRVLMPWNLVLEDHVAVGRDVEFYNFSMLHVQTMSVVSQNCYLSTGSHDFEDPHFPLTHAPIRIGRECWLAAGVFVCPGVTIPDGCVVGARSVVGKSLRAPWTVYAGNPCQPLRARRMKAPGGAA